MMESSSPSPPCVVWMLSVFSKHSATAFWETSLPHITNSTCTLVSEGTANVSTTFSFELKRHKKRVLEELLFHPGLCQQAPLLGSESCLGAVCFMYARSTHTHDSLLYVLLCLFAFFT